MTLQEMARKFADHKLRDDEIKKMKEENDAEWDVIEKEMMELMVQDGVPSIRIEGLGLFSLVTKNYLSVNAANKPQFFEYLQESGNGSLLKLDVHARTLEAFLKTHSEELISKFQAEGLDLFEAKEKAHGVLIARGAAHFKDQRIQMKKG